MDTGRIVRESKTMMMVSLVVGVIILGVGIVFSMMGSGIISNPKAIVGLSFIPFGVAFTYYMKMVSIQKAPQKMKEIIIQENDERLHALKNEADAKALRIVEGILFLTYTGYTLAVPGDIFEAVGWWLLMIVMFAAFIIQGIMNRIIVDTDNVEDSEG